MLNGTLEHIWNIYRYARIRDAAFAAFKGGRLRDQPLALYDVSTRARINLYLFYSFPLHCLSPTCAIDVNHVRQVHVRPGGRRKPLRHRSLLYFTTYDPPRGFRSSTVIYSTHRQWTDGRSVAYRNRVLPTYFDSFTSAWTWTISPT